MTSTKNKKKNQPTADYILDISAFIGIISLSYFLTFYFNNFFFLKKAQITFCYDWSVPSTICNEIKFKLDQTIKRDN